MRNTLLTDASNSFEARLVAIKALPQVAEKARREVREAAARNGKTPTSFRLLRCGWHIIVTNIPDDMMKAAEVSELYRCRWTIEIIFRAWKQSANLGPALKRKSNENHFQVLILAAMIHQALSLKAVAFVRRQLKRNQRISLEKLFDDFAEAFTKFTHLEDLWTYQPDHRHVTAETRKDRRPLEGTWNQVLKLMRMLQKPSKEPLNFSRRLPGGTRRY